MVKIVVVVESTTCNHHYNKYNFYNLFNYLASFEKITLTLHNQIMSIQRHFLFSLGLTSMSDASSFRDAVLAKIVLAQY